MSRRDNWLVVLKLLMWIGLVQGIVWTLLTLGFAAHTLIFIERSVTATGTIVELREKQDDEGSVTYAPAFTFSLKDGNQQTVVSNVGSNPSPFEVGEKVPVRYEPDDPSDAAINSFGQTWGFSIGFGIAAIVMTLFGLFFRWRVKKREARPRNLTKSNLLNIFER